MCRANLTNPDLYLLKNNLDENGILFTHNGPISQDLITGFANLIKLKLALNTPLTVVMKAIGIFIEQTQNIMHYSADRGPDERFGKGAGICIIGCEDEHYFIMCGNRIEKEMKAGLKTRLDHIIAMNKDELKQYFKEKRKEKPGMNTPGAGLGFIDMARKAYKPIEYAINDIDEKYCFFNLKVTI